VEIDLEYEADDNDDIVSIDTSMPHQISDSGHHRLKRRFLDSLAEFAAKEHGPLFVACAAMRESEGEVRILITRIEGFQSLDHEFFERLSKLLSSWSSYRRLNLGGVLYLRHSRDCESPSVHRILSG
jgi:hypothetical protein